ncbi:MAG TPA: hypothetical protein VHF27_09770 [Acidimicrobiales bacterium]|nr:hypothetical protein [Acidimicrobiales bacterium]
MLIVLIVIPAVIIAVGVVLLLDRTGVLPRLDGGPSLSRSGGGGFFESIPKGALFGAGALMVLWILAWLVFLVIGLSILAG